MGEQTPRADHSGFHFTSSTHTDTYPAIEPATKSDLTGKYVFVTGASKGVGRATAIGYAKAGAAAIGLGARSQLSSLEKEIQDAAKKAGKKAPKMLSVKLDVEDRASVEAAAKEIEASFGRLDILINNAGYLEKAIPIAESDPDEWWKTWTVVRIQSLPTATHERKLADTHMHTLRTFVVYT